MPNVQTLIERMIYWCRDANMGYSQSDRWNFNPNGGNCDCSSLVIHCLREAGFDAGGSTYTGNMWSNLASRGWRRLPVNGNPLPGDILLNDIHHVAVYIGSGRLAQASISEHGTAYGAAGDQTGRETNISNYYNYPWNCYLRFAGAQTNGDDDMSYCFAYTSDNFDGVKFFDGTYIHNLTHSDELKVLQTTHKQATGRDLPILKLGAKNAPWNLRFEQAIARRSI